jgi:peptidyl-prolyl cis-trans isomerase D
MLDGIRNNAQSWGIKIAFGVIIVVFIFWGIGGPSGSSSNVASINGMNISLAEFERAYEQAARQSGQFGLSPTEQRPFLAPMVLQRLMRDKLLEADAARAGVGVGVHELRRYMESIPLFRGEDGKFSEQAYRTGVSSLGMSVARFEDSIRTEMLVQKLQVLLSAGAYSPPGQARRVFDFARERRRIEYLFFPFEEYREQAVPTEEEILRAYAGREADFALPPRVRLEYVALDPREMGDVSAVSDADVAGAYQERLASFSRPERVRIRHIYWRLPADAPASQVRETEEAAGAAMLRLRGGEDFAALATEISQDGSASRGGELDWFSIDQVDPVFGEAAFALRPGEIAGPVRSRAGLHLIRLEEKEEASVRGLDEVREELRAALAGERAAATLPAAADAVLAAVFGGKSLAEAARASGLEARTTDLMDAETLAATLEINPPDVQTIMNSLSDTLLDYPLDTPGGKLVARVAESLPAMIRPLEEARDELTASLIQSKSRELALAAAQAVAAAFEDGRLGGDLAATARQSELFGRDGYLPGLGMNAELARAVFELPASEAGTGRWQPAAFSMDEGAVLVSLAEAVPPGEEEWLRDGESIRADLEQSRADFLFQIYQNMLEQGARQQIFQPAVLGQT